MPKVIKKRPAKKKAIKEPEVKNFALKTLEEIKTRQKQFIIGGGAVVGVLLLFIIISVYLSSQRQEAYGLEIEASNYYYGAEGGDVQSVQERTQKAIELYRKSISAKATPTALYLLGNSYYRLGDFENAIKEYNSFVKTFSGEKAILPLVYQKLASAYFKSSKPDKALNTLKSLSKVDGGIYKDSALILEARYYDSREDADKAQGFYKEIAAGFPSSPWAAEAQARISAAETAVSESPEPAAEDEDGTPPSDEDAQ